MTKNMSNGKLSIYHGLPGCGKSTYAENVYKADPENTVIVNRDNTRTELFGEAYHNSKFSAESEQSVTEINHKRISEALQAGKHVISDDTNLKPVFIEVLVRLARKNGATIEQKHFNVSVETCIERNKERGKAGGRRVPNFIIRSMSNSTYSISGDLKKFIINPDGTVRMSNPDRKFEQITQNFNKEAEAAYPITGQAVVLVDLDGTLANNSRDLDRAFGVPNQKRNFHLFHSLSGVAPVNENVLALINDMRNDGLNLIALSGRSEAYSAETVEFLKRANAPVSRLILKPVTDHRPDTSFKREVIAALEDEGLIVVHAIDDRQRVVDMFEDEGIMVSRVPEHIPVDPATGPLSYDAPEVSTVFGTGTCIRCGDKNGVNLDKNCGWKVI